MTIRYLKIILVLFVALLCLMYATQNLVNFQAANFFVTTVFSMQDHAAYPAAFGPAITQPALVWTGLIIIIIGELAAGLLSLKGAWDLWAARTASADTFNSAKKLALTGGGLALVVWFGLFTTLGGAYFQMWQTALGGGSLQNASQFVVQIGMVLLFVNIRDQSV